MKNFLDIFEKHIPIKPFFILMFIASIGLSAFQPFKNWDMICYIASAKAFEESDVKKLHDFTYQETRKEVTRKEYELMVSEGYREIISTDVTAFAEQLPFYQIRPVYNAVVYMLYKAGVDIGYATYILSGVAVAIAMILLYQMSRVCLTQTMAFVILLLILHYRVFELPRFSTPDGLAFLAVVATAYFYIRKAMLAVFVTAILIVGIRGDYILFTLPLLFCIALFDKDNRMGAVIAIALSIMAYLMIARYWSNPGWSTIIYFTLVEQLPHPLSQPPVLSLDVYLNLLTKGSRKLIKNKRFVMYLLFSIYMIYMLAKELRAKPWSNVLGSAPVILFSCSLFFVVAHFILFPLVQDRFFVAAYLIGSFAVLWQLNQINQARSGNEAGHVNQ